MGVPSSGKATVNGKVGRSGILGFAHFLRSYVLNFSYAINSFEVSPYRASFLLALIRSTLQVDSNTGLL